MASVDQGEELIEKTGTERSVFPAGTYRKNDNEPCNKRVRDILGVRHVHCAERAVSVKRLHTQSITVNDVPFTDLNHNAAVGDDPPGCVQKLADQGVDDAIYTAVTSLSHDLLGELCVAGRKHSASRDAVVVFEELALLL